MSNAAHRRRLEILEAATPEAPDEDLSWCPLSELRRIEALSATLDPAALELVWAEIVKAHHPLGVE